jgi:ABC-2 type transport system permease protein
MTTVSIPMPLRTEPARVRAAAAVPTLALRRLALTMRTPRSVAVPLLGPVIFALVLAPALANTVADHAQRNTYMTYYALATAGLLIPLNCMFSGLGVVLDRQHGALPELLVAPIRRSSIVLGNLLAALAITALQLAVLILVAAARGADFHLGGRVLWFLAAAAVFSVTMYSIAEVLATKLTTPEEYTSALPPVAIVPFFFAGSLYPITALPHWLEPVARILPLTHAIALFRYGLTDDRAALYNIWGAHNPATTATLSLLVVVAYAAVALAGAVRLFTRSATS